MNRDNVPTRIVAVTLFVLPSITVTIPGVDKVLIYTPYWLMDLQLRRPEYSPPATLRQVRSFMESKDCEVGAS